MRLIFLLCCLAGATGWISTGPQLLEAIKPPKEIPVTVLATAESLDHAKKVCQGYRERTGGVVGHVDVYDIAGDWYAVPCRVILEAK